MVKLNNSVNLFLELCPFLTLNIWLNFYNFNTIKDIELLSKILNSNFEYFFMATRHLCKSRCITLLVLYFRVMTLFNWEFQVNFFYKCNDLNSFKDNQSRLGLLPYCDRTLVRVKLNNSVNNFFKVIWNLNLDYLVKFLNLLDYQRYSTQTWYFSYGNNTL